MGIALSKAIVFVSVCVCFLKLNKAQRCMESNYGIPNRTKNCWIKLFSWFSIELLFACSIQYYFLSLLFHYFILQILPIPIIARKRKKKKNRELSGRQAINLRLQQASISISLWVIGFTLQQVLLLVSFFSSIFTFLAIIFAFRMYTKCMYVWVCTLCGMCMRLFLIETLANRSRNYFIYIISCVCGKYFVQLEKQRSVIFWYLIDVHATDIITLTG